MRPAVELRDNLTILADGAMGTYYAQLAGSGAVDCELANLADPGLIRQIHQEYLAAGARLLRTNTFAAAALLGSGDPDRLSGIIRAGYQIAAECAGDLAFVAADLGPTYSLEPADGQAANQIVLDTFLELGAGLFIFETFADPAEFLPFCEQIKHRSPQAIIVASFTLSADGYTRKGLSIEQLSQIMEATPLIDIWGFNCGIGPTHLAQQVRRLPDSGKPLTLMPNSGYPRLENQRLVFGSTPDYFAQASASLLAPRTRLIGGCCGTTPQHIRAIRQMLSQPAVPAHAAAATLPPARISRLTPVHGRLADKLYKNEFVVVCELDPPRSSQMDPTIAAARLLQLAGFDAITLADSPLARVKMEPVSCAARLFRETGLPVLPHLCCRDRNANNLRSTLLAAHSEGIRQILAITGDAIPESDMGFVKPVFNLNSIGLLSLINQMNQDVFAGDPLLAAAALDPGVPNPAAEFARVLRKKEQGATLLLTQPVFDLLGLPLIRQVRAAGLKVLIGLMPLVSYRNARYMSEEVPGIRIPPAIVARFNPDQTRESALATGLRATLEIAAAVRPDADGFYLIAPFNRADIMVRLLDSMRQEGLL
jgi:methionine synthase I (cobalamin-dependent)/5,10-methylenetetrahydrofolate reductase